MSKEKEQLYMMLKNKIQKRKELFGLYYSKLEVKEKLEKEIEDIRKEVDEIDKYITVNTPTSDNSG